MDLLLREYELVSKWRKRSSNYRCNLKNIDEASEAIRGDLKSIAAGLRNRWRRLYPAVTVCLGNSDPGDIREGERRLVFWIAQ